MSSLVDPVALAKAVAQTTDLWQLAFMDVSRLAEYARRRALSPASAATILALWRLGLLRADLVRSQDGLDVDGLVAVGRDGLDRLLYADARTAAPEEAWSQSARLGALQGVEPLFHPFRYYVLSHAIPPWQAGRVQMLAQIGLTRPATVSTDMQSLAWIREDEVRGALVQASQAVDLAVLAEPCTYPAIVGNIVMRDLLDEEEVDELSDAHWPLVRDVFLRVGLQTVVGVIETIVKHAGRFDRNVFLQQLVRMANERFRDGLQRHIGAAVAAGSVAECIRRAAERAFEVELPEEDELGGALGDTKRALYGTARLLDGDQRVRQEVVRQFAWTLG